MDGLKPISLSYITKTASISTLETFQGRLNRKIAKAVEAPKTLLEGYAKTAKGKLLPFKHDTSKTPVKNSIGNGFVSKYL